MIDRIRTQLRPVIKKHEEEAKDSQTGQKREQMGQNKGQQEDRSTQKSLHSPLIPLSLLKSMVEELNNHPYYQEKKFLFSVVEKKEYETVVAKVIHRDTNKTIQSLSSVQLERFYSTINKTGGPSSTGEKGNLINIAC